MAVEEDSLKILGDLLTLPDIDVNARNKDGETALMMAARLGSARIAQELLNRSRFGLVNADINLHLYNIDEGIPEEIPEDYADERGRKWDRLPLVAAVIAEREGFISLKTAILNHKFIPYGDWERVIWDCDQRKAELEAAISGLAYR